MTAAKKYWETHDYDTFECKFVHPDKEAYYQAVEAEETAQQPMKSFNRLPPSLQKGEGYVYDITTHVVKNEDLYGKKKAEEQRWIDSKKASWQRAANTREAGIEKQQRSEQMAINRQSHMRYVEGVQHGYNIVDHRDYRDPSVYIPPPRTQPTFSLWETMETQRFPSFSESFMSSSGARRDAPNTGSQASAHIPPPSMAAPPSAAPSTAASSRSSVRTGGFQRVAAE